MDVYQTIALGVVQGLTEFLPVSSSGHLVLLQNVLGFHEPELLFDISVHIGTLIAVCTVFFKDIVNILSALFRLPHLRRREGGYLQVLRRSAEIKMAVLIIVGTVPTVILGILFHEAADSIFGSIRLVGVSLLVTGTFLWLSRNAGRDGKQVLQVKNKDSLMVGLAQGIAIIPGISRSGSTISTALFLGIDRDLAGRFSFLLSIPAIFGALVLNLKSPVPHTGQPLTTLFIGGGSAALVGYFALKILLKVVKKGRFYMFSPYCWLLGIVAIAWSAWG